MLMLAVEVHEKFRDLSLYGEGDGRIGDEAPALAFGGNFSPDDKFLGALEIVRFKDLEQGPVACDMEDPFDHGLPCTFADNICTGPVPEDESERIDDDRFSGTGLSRDNDQAVGELNAEGLDQGIVLYGEGFQHERIYPLFGKDSIYPREAGGCSVQTSGGGRIRLVAIEA